MKSTKTLISTSKNNKKPKFPPIGRCTSNDSYLNRTMVNPFSKKKNIAVTENIHFFLQILKMLYEYILICIYFFEKLEIKKVTIGSFLLSML